jgi:hypothetical protein
VSQRHRVREVTFVEPRGEGYVSLKVKASEQGGSMSATVSYDSSGQGPEETMTLPWDALCQLPSMIDSGRRAFGQKTAMDR